ncbi:hypothetical protein GCM10022198_13150 [Klugiella xanthotipulae]
MGITLVISLVTSGTVASAATTTTPQTPLMAEPEGDTAGKDSVSESVVADTAGTGLEISPAAASDWPYNNLCTAPNTYGFGKNNSYGISDPRSGTVLGYNGVPTDVGAANGHFVYLPTPVTSVEYRTGYLETLSLAKYVDGDASNFGLSIDSAGKVWAWGGNRYGQLGIGISGNPTNTDYMAKYYPERVTTLPSTATFVQVSAGSRHALALSSDGDIYAWGGTNNSGQLGQGNITVVPNGQNTALKVQAPAGVKFINISAGHDFSLAVSTTGVVYGWGYNNYGSLAGVGGGTLTALSGLSNITQVSAGYQHAGAVSSTGVLYMWGMRSSGRLGDGSNTSSGAGVTQIMTGVKQVSAAWASSYAVTTGGVLYSWGNNSYGQLGILDAEGLPRTTPQNTGVTGVKQVSGGTQTATIVTTAGGVYTAGTNAVNLQLGAGNANTIYRTFTGPVLSGATEVATGYGAAGAKAGNTSMWGNGTQVGRGLASFLTPGVLTGVSGTPATTWVTVPSTVPVSGQIAFGNPATQTQGAAGYQLALNTRVVSNAGVNVLRGDVPAHVAGPTPVYVKWDNGGTWTRTGCYTYTVGLKVASAPSPARTTQAVDVTTSVYDPKEQPYLGQSVADFGISAVSGGSPALILGSGATVTGVPFASGTPASAVTRVKLTAPTPSANDGAHAWKYPVSATARVETSTGNVTVSRNVPAGDVRFYTIPNTYTCDVDPQWLNVDKVGGTVTGWADDRAEEILKIPAAAARGIVYFGDPALGSGVGKSQAVSVTAADIRTENGQPYYAVKVPRHVVGGVEVYVSWEGSAPTQIGCYTYRLGLNISPDPNPQTAGGEIVVTAYVNPGEELLTGDSLVDISIPAVGTQVAVVAGQKLTGLSLVGGKVTTKVRLVEPRPTPTEANGDWKYPDSAIAWVPSNNTKTSLASDPGGVIVSGQAVMPTPWVWWTPRLPSSVYLWKTGESTTSREVGMSGSSWAVYGTSPVTPGTPNRDAPVVAFPAEITNPNTSAPDRQMGWFRAELMPGTYWLAETRAPSGFQLMAEMVEFTVAIDGSLTLERGHSPYIRVTDDWDASQRAHTIVVRDPGSTELPESGGSGGQRWMTLLGTLLLAGAAGWAIRRVQVQARRITVE